MPFESCVQISCGTKRRRFNFGLHLFPAHFSHRVQRTQLYSLKAVWCNPRKCARNKSHITNSRINWKKLSNIQILTRFLLLKSNQNKEGKTVGIGYVTFVSREEIQLKRPIESLPFFPPRVQPTPAPTVKSFSFDLKKTKKRKGYRKRLGLFWFWGLC